MTALRVLFYLLVAFGVLSIVNWMLGIAVMWMLNR
jgi:hypothetical protein